MKTLKELEIKQEKIRAIRPITKEEYGIKKYKEALKDVLKLIDEFDFRRFFPKSSGSGTLRFNSKCKSPQVIEEVIKFELKSKIIGEEEKE